MPTCVGMRTPFLTSDSVSLGQLESSEVPTGGLDTSLVFPSLHVYQVDHTCAPLSCLSF